MFYSTLGEGPRDRSGSKRWEVRCVCGARRLWTNHQLKRNKSCGCKKSELATKQLTTHGLSGSKIYNVWNHMISRCNNERDKSWDRYGGRGIRVCARWTNSFAAFAEDMLPTYRDGLTIERKNNNKGYSKANCIWVPLGLQAKNRRTTQKVQTPWGLMIAVDCARKVGIGHSGLRKRIASWPKSRWFEPPRKRNMPSKSPAQKKTMAAIAHGWRPPKGSKVSKIPKKVAKEFNVAADKRKKK